MSSSLAPPLPSMSLTSIGHHVGGRLVVDGRGTVRWTAGVRRGADFAMPTHR